MHNDMAIDLLDERRANIHEMLDNRPRERSSLREL